MSALSAIRALKGFFCVYKPAEKTVTQLVWDIQKNVTHDLNRLPDRPMRQRVVYNEKNLGTSLPVATTVPDLADHPLVIGERYLIGDVQVEPTDALSQHSCGLMVMCVNTEESEILRKTYSLSRQMKVYHVKGKLGIGTIDWLPTGKLVEKSTFRHVSQNKMDKVLARIQSGHQKYMFDLSGVNIQSQEAYELASQGLIRPAVTEHTNPLIYSIKCIHFKPPFFTLEIHCINEFCRYLRKLIHDIGLELKTNAVCTQVRRIRFGNFTLDHVLLRQQWHLENILRNIDACRDLLTEDRLRIDGNLKEIDSTGAELRLPAGQDLIGQDININYAEDDGNLNVIDSGADLRIENKENVIGQDINIKYVQDNTS